MSHQLDTLSSDAEGSVHVPAPPAFLPDVMDESDDEPLGEGAATGQEEDADVDCLDESSESEEEYGGVTLKTTNFQN